MFIQFFRAYKSPVIMDGSSSDIYKPEHPLPDEIQQMARDDTVCQFCGVSYLMHNEIKQLQKEIEKYQKEIDRLLPLDLENKKLIVQIEKLYLDKKIQNETFDIEVNRCIMLSEKISEKDSLYNSVTKRIAFVEAELTEVRLQKEKMEKDFGKTCFHIKNIHQDCKTLSVLFHGKSMRDLQTDLMDGFEVMKGKLMEKVNECQQEILKGNTEFHATFDNLKDQIHVLKEKYKEKGGEAQTTRILLNKCTAEVLSLNEEIEYQKKEYDNAMTSKTHCVELMKTEHKRAIECLSSELLQANATIERLKLDIAHMKEGRSRDIKASQEALVVDNQRLKKEREKTITSHHFQVEQLRESYLQKLHSSNASTAALKAEMDKREDELLKEKVALKTGLLRAHEEEMTNLEARHAESVHNFKKLSLDKEKKMKERMDHVQEVFEEKFKLLQDRCDSFETENARLVEVARKSEDLKEQYKRNHDNKMLEDVQQVLKLTQKELAEIESELSRSRDEIKMLKECVKRECAERFELTESLAQTKTELLALQRFQKKPRHLIPSPPSITSPPQINSAKESRSKVESVSNGMSGKRETVNNLTRRSIDKNKFKVSLRNAINR